MNHSPKFPTPEMKLLYNSFTSQVLLEPDVTAGHLYGSYASNMADQYSDLDLVLYSTSLLHLLSNLKKIIYAVGEVYVIFPVLETENEYVFTVYWKQFSLYCRLDLTIRSVSLLEPNIPLLFNRQPSKIDDHHEQYDFTLNDRHVYDFFIGIIRFVKYYKRGKKLAMYKFYKSAFESMLKEQAIANKLTNNRNLTLDLTLFLTIENHFGTVFEKYFDISTPQKMYNNITDICREVEILHNKDTRYSPNTRIFVDDVLKFLQDEFI